MQLEIYVEKEQRTTKVNFAKNTLQELLEDLKINSETVIAVRNKEVITADEKLNDKDKIELLSVISGG